MKRRLLTLFVLGMLLTSLSAPNTVALTLFKKPFDEAYVKDSDDDEFKALFKKNGCNVCHVKGKKRDVVNAYGMELSKLIPGNAKQRIATAKEDGSETKDVEEEIILKELKAAMKKAEKIKLPAGETYGEMLHARRLPLGEAVGSVAVEEDEKAE